MRNLFKSAVLVILGIVCNPVTGFGQSGPIVIQNQRELFVDDYLIQKLNKMEVRLATPVSGGKALAFTEPWEGQFGLALSIIKERYHRYRSC